MFFLFKQKTAYEIEYGLVGSEMVIRDRDCGVNSNVVIAGLDPAIHQFKSG